MTAFRRRRYDPIGRGVPISAGARDVYDFDRLERVVADLAESLHQHRSENASLRRKLEERGREIRSLEGQLLETNQKRQDVAKRVDELIAQLDHLDARLDRAEV